MNSKIIAAANKYLASGLNVIPLDDNKRPIVEWQKLMSNKVKNEEVGALFKDAKGIAVICGAISGNLEVIDWDLKYDLSGGKMYEEAYARIPDELKEKIAIIKTKNNGYHWMYRCPVIEGNQRLAIRPTTSEERADNSSDKIRVLAETRGNGGYVATYPSNGYSVVKSNGIKEITEEERETLFCIASSYNEVYNESEFYEQISVEKEEKWLTNPFTDFNNRERGVNLLFAAGWTHLGESGRKIRIRRPNATSESSGYYDQDTNKVLIYSTSTIFDNTKAYSPVEIYCILNCNGDWKRCFKELIEKGYGARVKVEDEIKKLKNKFITTPIVNLIAQEVGGEVTKTGKIKIQDKEYSL